MSTRLPGAVALATVGVLCAGAVVTAAPATAASTRPTVRITATSTHHVSAPATARPGLAHLINTGSKVIFLFRKTGKGVADLVADANGYTDTAGSVRLYKDFAVTDVIAPHADEYVRFTKGTYFALDGSARKFTASLVHTVTVKGATTNATAPRSTLEGASPTGKITGSPSIVHRTYARVVNNAGSPHIISILAIKAGVTQKQINAAIANPADHSWQKLAGSYFEPLGYIAAHTGIYKRVVAKPGRYFRFSASLTHPGLGEGQLALLTVK